MNQDLHTHLLGSSVGLGIIAENVVKTFGEVKALNGVSITIEPGTVLALLGPNGAGKTTLVRILTTLLKPDSGRAVVGGYEVVKDSQELRSIMGLAGQSAAIDDILTGRENLELVGKLYHLKKDETRRRAQQLLEQFDLLDAADRMAKTYSGGMRRRLDLAASLVGRPKILFLDEPTSGLDPRSRTDLWQVINKLVQEGTTILLTTQYLEEADHLADKIVVINHGKVIAEGTSDDLKSRVGGDVIEIHLVDHKKTLETGEIVKSLGSGEPKVDLDEGKVTLPVAKGTLVLAQVVRQLDAVNIELADIVLRRPTLDDVFLALTGHTAQ